VPSQHFMESEVAQTNALKPAAGFDCQMLWLSLTEAASQAREAKDLSGPGADNGNCLFGFSVAIAMEAAVAVTLYGIWWVWHLI